MEAAHNAIRLQVSGSPFSSMIGATMTKALENCTPQIELAVKAAVEAALSDQDTINKIVKEALIGSAGKATGQFDAVMKRVGKDLCLDRKTMEQLVESIKISVALDAEKIGLGAFS